MWPIRRLLGAGLATALAGATVGMVPSTGQAAPTEPGLRTDPTTGEPGTALLASATGFGACFPATDKVRLGQVELRWTETDDTWTADLDRTGAANAEIPVPVGFGPGPHDLEASCTTDPELQSAATFTVLQQPVTPPTLDLDPPSGRPGSVVTANATGYGLCFSATDDVSLGQVAFRWVGDEQLWTADLDPAGNATTDVTVPVGFAAGPHDLEASCTTDPELQSTAPFIVSAAPPTPPDLPERLELAPDRGAPGTEVRATGTGYECDGEVVYLAGADEVARAAADQEGTVVRDIVVPLNVEGTYDVVAQCETDASQSAAAQFTVTPPSPSPTPTPTPTPTGTNEPSPGPGPVDPASSASDPTSWWPVALIAGLLFAVPLLLRHAGIWPRPRISVVAGTAGASVRTSETPADPSAPDITVRIEPHHDPGTHMLKEVDP